MRKTLELATTAFDQGKLRSRLTGDKVNDAYLIGTKRNGLYVTATELRWVRLGLLHEAPAALRQQDMPHKCLVVRHSRVPTPSTRELLRTRGSTELWLRTHAFKVGSGERDGVPRVEGTELDGEPPSQSSGRSMFIEGAVDVENGEGLLPRKKYSYQGRGRDQGKVRLTRDYSVQQTQRSQVEVA